VKRVIGKAILRVESRELGKIVELMECPGERYAILICSEVTSVNGVCNFGSCRRAMT